MNKLLFLIILCLTISAVQAKNIKIEYIAAIPDSLKKGANAVIREENKKVEILSLSKVVVTVHKVITVLNEKGERKAWEAVHYNKNTNILTLNASMYNALGVETEKWTKNKWKDEGYDTYGTAYSDLRRKMCRPYNNSYPYTLEYDYSYEENNTYGIEGWYPLWEDNLSVIQSSYEISFDPSLQFKYKEYNFNDDIIKEENGNTYKWELKNLKPFHNEPYRPSASSFAPFLRVGLETFTYDNFEGKTDSWKSYGDFLFRLNKNRDELPDEKKAEIDAILDTCTTEFSKVSSLYKYMQSHTRYVNISIGIGGIQTFPAETVALNGYGDCKALSNYMSAILKYAGIKSYCTAVKAGSYSYSYDPNFVSHQGNHIILCVPLATDTIWLECTSQTMPCGFLGDFTDNRHVLLITEDGGILTKTPKYDKNENKVVRNTTVTIQESGDCEAVVNSIYTGLEYDEKHRLTTEDKESQLKMLYKDFDIPNFIINSFDLDAQYSSHPKLDEKIDLKLNNYASKSGSRLFVPLNLASKWTYVPRKIKKRFYNIRKPSEYCQIDTVSYNIPKGYEIEVLPNKENYENKYGSYVSETKVEGDNIIYIRSLEMNSGLFPAEEYNEFRAFYAKIKKSDSVMAILKKIQ